MAELGGMGVFFGGVLGSKDIFTLLFAVERLLSWLKLLSLELNKLRPHIFQIQM